MLLSLAGRRGKAWRKVKPPVRDGRQVLQGSDLTDQPLRWQTKQLLARETARQGIAVLVRPDLVVEIALDGVRALLPARP